MKRIAIILAACLAAPLLWLGCDSGSSGSNDLSVTGDLGGADQSAGGDLGANPAVPTLGSQIDRVGRAGVNTALTNPFELVDGKTTAQVQDEYNGASDPSTWKARFAPAIATNLAILDGADGTCGNALGVMPPSSDAGTRYDFMAGVLADDQLYVDTTQGVCSIYLAVEAKALGVSLADCGGRTPLMDVIDPTYSVLTIGMFSGVTDGVDADTDTNAANAATFPFLGAPNAGM